MKKERKKVRNSGRISGASEHNGYLDGDEKFNQFKTYLSQLKKVLNPEKVNKAIERHDTNLENWR